jgi:hypothetical protein
MSNKIMIHIQLEYTCKETTVLHHDDLEYSIRKATRTAKCRRVEYELSAATCALKVRKVVVRVPHEIRRSTLPLRCLSEIQLSDLSIFQFNKPA